MISLSLPDTSQVLKYRWLIVKKKKTKKKGKFIMAIESYYYPLQWWNNVYSLKKNIYLWFRGILVILHKILIIRGLFKGIFIFLIF